MKITSIEIHPDGSSDVLTLSFRDPTNLNPYNVQTITGLDGQALDQRTIAMKIGLNPNFRSYGDLRDTVYKMISSSRTGLVQLQFKNALTVVAAISGFISKVETSQFDKDQIITVTVQCDDPFLRAMTRSSFPVIGFDLTAMNILDDGSTAPHGAIFQIGILNPISSLTISSPVDTSWSFEVIPSGGFLSGDELYISSEDNNKYVYLIRDFVTIQLGDVVVPGSTWPVLFPGTNVLEFSNSSDLRLDVFEYYPTFWGV